MTVFILKLIAMAAMLIDHMYSVDNGFIHSHDTMRIKTHGGKYHGKKKQT